MMDMLGSIRKSMEQFAEALRPALNRMAAIYPLLFPHIAVWQAMKPRVRFAIRRKYIRETGNDDWGRDFDNWLAAQGIKPKERR